MNAEDKITKCRKLYIMQYGKEPKSIILGYEILEEVKEKYSQRYVADGVEILGMRVIEDRDKPTRVEVGNLAV